MILTQNPPYDKRAYGCEVESVNMILHAKFGGHYRGWLAVIRREFKIDNDQVMDIVKGIQEYGLVDEAYYPYTPENVRKRLKDISPEVKSHAVRVNVEAGIVPLNMLDTILKYEPVICVTPIFDSFKNLPRDGIVRLTPTTGRSRHCMVIVEKTNLGRLLLYYFINSYGVDWGVDGHCFFPTAYLHRYRSELLLYTLNFK